ncbi:hypothetical protein CVT24_011234 [Panaeolus cyanescens]|uniref:Thioester reductase (TE) domain-containing protein n=1 Tax=Panaeolus cyanescens TaxID=181874 RepID=A0A409YGG5_9AGAR|nr:hypothetical protein CVT24_011234 [Panaeolus cyanescens]
MPHDDRSSRTHPTSVQDIEDLIGKYRIDPEGLKPPLTSKVRGSSDGEVVLVTGTTGSLGAYVLAYLLDNPQVIRVYAFNRPGIKAKSHLERHIQSFSDAGLNLETLNDSRLTFVEGNLETELDDRFGIDQSVYDEMHQTVTTIIHLAWPVTMKWELSKFEPSIKAACNLMKFGLTTPSSYANRQETGLNVDQRDAEILMAPKRLPLSPVKFIFSSSILTAMSWTKTTTFPEEVQANPVYALGLGYGEAKYVVQRILQETPLNSTSLLMGQLCGSRVNGSWVADHWFPRLVTRWLPIDIAAWHLTELAMCPKSRKERYPQSITMLNPRPTPLEGHVRLTIEALHKQKLVSYATIDADAMVPPSVWLERFSEGFRKINSGRNAKELKLIAPVYEELYSTASTLIIRRARLRVGGAQTTSLDSQREVGFFGPFEMENIYQWSPTFREIQAISVEDIEGWILYWKKKGLFVGVSKDGGQMIRSKL